jgi:hypothetical protein
MSTNASYSFQGTPGIKIRVSPRVGDIARFGGLVTIALMGPLDSKVQADWRSGAHYPSNQRTRQSVTVLSDSRIRKRTKLDTTETAISSSSGDRNSFSEPLDLRTM